MLRSTATTHVNRNWARAQINTYHRRQKPDEKHQAFKGGRIRGEMFDGSIGTDSLSAKFSFHKIKARTKALETEAQNEMWLTRPYLSKEETDFMNNGVYTPKRNIEHDENVVLDDFGGVINRGKHTGRLNPEQIKEKFGHEMLPLKYVRGLKQKQEQSEIMNRKQLKPDVRGADIWKSMEKYRTWERDDEVDLDFYRKYHNMAVPKAYPTTMPMAREKWGAWSRVEGFTAPKESQVSSEKSNDFIPHPLSYDVSVEKTEQYATSDEDNELARHPFAADYVKENSSASLEHAAFGYQQENRLQDGESFNYKEKRKTEILDNNTLSDVRATEHNFSPDSVEPLYGKILAAQPEMDKIIEKDYNLD